MLYLKAKWLIIISGIILEIVAETCTLISPFLSRYLIDFVLLAKIIYILNPNTITAIKGPTGAGKTTLAKLMVRFFDPQEGQILLDGIDIGNIKLQSLRKNVLLILNEYFVFNGTLYENLLYVYSKNLTENKNNIILI